MPNDQNFFSVKARHAANDRRIVGKTAVAVNLTPVGEDSLHVVEGIGPLGMACHLGPLPWIQVRGNFPPQIIHAVMQLLDLTSSFFVLPFERLQPLDLLLDLGQFLLRFESRIHLDGVPIPADVMRFHDREQELGSHNRGIAGAVLRLFRSCYFRSIQCRTC